MMMKIDEMIDAIRVQQAAAKAATSDQALADAEYEIGRLKKMLRNDHALDDKQIEKLLRSK
jgi:hypothetical protein